MTDVPETHTVVIILQHIQICTPETNILYANYTSVKMINRIPYGKSIILLFTVYIIITTITFYMITHVGYLHGLKKKNADSFSLYTLAQYVNKHKSENVRLKDKL